MSQVFNALTGPELVKVILADVEKRLLATGAFGSNITFPWVRYTVSIGLLSYPKQDRADSPKIKVVAEDELGERPPEAEVVTAEIPDSGDAIVDAPDKARIEAGLPIPTTAPGPGGVLVDKPVVPERPRSTPKPVSARRSK